MLYFCAPPTPIEGAGDLGIHFLHKLNRVRIVTRLNLQQILDKVALIASIGVT